MPLFRSCKAVLKQIPTHLILTAGVTLTMVSPAQPQSWLTREACDISAINTYDPDFKSRMDEIRRIEVRSRTINSVGKLWEIRHHNGHVSYLWGSLHSSDGLVLDLPEALLKRISEVEVAYFEHTFNHMTRDELSDLNTRKRWDNPITASHWLQKTSPVIKAAVVDRFKFFGINPTQLSSLKATAAVEYLLSDPCEDFNRRRFPVQDVYIEMLADHQGVEIEGLENVDSLSDAAYGFWNNNLPIAIINVYAANLVEPKMTSREIAVARRVEVELYRHGEIGKMMAWGREHVLTVLGAEDGDTHLKRANHYLLEKRNKNFKDRLLQPLSNRKSLVVVGAFHLPGEQGMIELLRKEGMIVTRVAVPGESR